jgi:propionyl-CoA carboxylase alpha chain
MIRIAAGQKLSLSQPDIKIKGHAIEARAYAEDPKTYLPSTGRLTSYIEPKGPLVRCDSGVTEGSEISVYYDPMIAKLVTHAPTRPQAITMMQTALDNFMIQGVKSNTSLLYDITTNDKFVACDLATDFLDVEYKNGFEEDEERYLCELACVASFVYTKREEGRFMWIEGGPVMANSPQAFDLYLKIGSKEVVSKVTSVDGSVTVHTFSCKVECMNKKIKIDSTWSLQAPIINATLNDEKLTMLFLDKSAVGFSLGYHGIHYNITALNSVEREASKHMQEKKTTKLQGVVQSPMPGLVLGVAVSPGQHVSKGQELAVIEAMKMQVLHLNILECYPFISVG